MGGLRAVYSHVISKFSGMGRFTYPCCSAISIIITLLNPVSCTRHNNVKSTILESVGKHVINSSVTMQKIGIKFIDTKLDTEIKIIKTKRDQGCTP